MEVQRRGTASTKRSGGILADDPGKAAQQEAGGLQNNNRLQGRFNLVWMLRALRGGIWKHSSRSFHEEPDCISERGGWWDCKCCGVS